MSDIWIRACESGIRLISRGFRVGWAGHFRGSNRANVRDFTGGKFEVSINSETNSTAKEFSRLARSSLPSCWPQFWIRKPESSGQNLICPLRVESERFSLTFISFFFLPGKRKSNFSIKFAAERILPK